MQVNEHEVQTIKAHWMLERCGWHYYYKRPIGFPGRTEFNKDKWVTLTNKARVALAKRGFVVVTCS